MVFQNEQGSFHEAVYRYLNWHILLQQYKKAENRMQEQAEVITGLREEMEKTKQSTSAEKEVSTSFIAFASTANETIELFSV